MPKIPDNLGSKLKWSALALLALSGGMVYVSSTSRKPARTLVDLGDDLNADSSKSAKIFKSDKFKNLGNPEKNETHKLTSQEVSVSPVPNPNANEFPLSIDLPARTQPQIQTHPQARAQTHPTKMENSNPSLANTPAQSNGIQTTPAGSDPRSNAMLSGTNHRAEKDHLPLPSKNEFQTNRFNKADNFSGVTIDKAPPIDAVTFEKSQDLNTKTPSFSKTNTAQSSSDSARNRLLSSKSNPTLPVTPSSNQKTQSPQKTDEEEDPSEPPPLPFSENSNQSGGGTHLPLAKPYCFLLPKSSPALQCAMESVKLIVEEYAKADVHVVPLFRWWGDDYSDDPNTLEQQAQQACNLQNAFPWVKGGNQTGSIQVFTRDPIPTKQCKKKYPEDAVSGCSNLCPSGSPSFSTVSEAQCSAGTALHESGHSNCCAAKCHNQGDCKPPPGVDAGCGLCLETGGQMAFGYLQNLFEASKSPKECKLTAAALESIRAGASPNPGYLSNPNNNYKPRGKKLDSIFGQKGVKKLYRGMGDQADGDGNGQGEGNAMPQNDGSAVSRKTAGKKSGSQSTGDEDKANEDNPDMYKDSEVNKMILGQ